MDEGAAPGPVCGEAGNGADSGRRGEESMRHPREDEVTVGLIYNKGDVLFPRKRSERGE